MTFDFKVYIVLWLFGCIVGFSYALDYALNFLKKCSPFQRKKYIKKYKTANIFTAPIFSFIVGLLFYLSIILMDYISFLLDMAPVPPEEKYWSFVIYLGIIIIVGMTTIGFAMPQKQHQYS